MLDRYARNGHSSEESLVVPIESVPLGARVSDSNPRPGDFDFSLGPVQAADWRRVEFRVQRTDGTLVEIELLRPVGWIERYGLSVGVQVDLRFSDVDLAGPATVVAIEACPSIAPGPGNVVTGRFVTRLVDNLVAVRFADGTELVGTTTHPVWVVEHSDWIPLGDLVSGQHVWARQGPLAISSVTPLRQTADAYNLETHGHHVYRVAPSAVLVHNAYVPKGPAIALGKDIPGGGYKQLAEQVGASQWRNWAKDGITRRNVANRFGRAYHQAAQRASKIHFALDGIDDVAAAIEAGKKGFIPGNMTNAELEYIFRNPEILKKTIFYRNGQIVPLQALWET